MCVGVKKKLDGISGIKHKVEASQIGTKSVKRRASRAISPSPPAQATRKENKENKE